MDSVNPPTFKSGKKLFLSKSAKKEWIAMHQKKAEKAIRLGKQERQSARQLAKKKALKQREVILDNEERDGINDDERVDNEHVNNGQNMLYQVPHVEKELGDTYTIPPIGELVKLDVNPELVYYSFDSCKSSELAAKRALKFYTELNAQASKAITLINTQINQPRQPDQNTLTKLIARIKLLTQWISIIAVIKDGLNVLIEQHIFDHEISEVIFSDKDPKENTRQVSLRVEANKSDERTVKFDVEKMLNRDESDNSDNDTRLENLDLSAIHRDKSAIVTGLNNPRHAIINPNLNMSTISRGEPLKKHNGDTTIHIPENKSDQFIKRKDLDSFCKVDFRPAAANWDVEEFIRTFQQKITPLSDAGKVLAFAYLLKVKEVPGATYQNLAKFVHLDVERGFYSSWEAIVSHLTCYYRYDCCRHNAEAGFEEMKTWFPDYNANATLDEFNDRYLWFMSRLGKNYLVSNYHEVVNYWSILPDNIAAELKKLYLQPNITSAIAAGSAKNISSDGNQYFLVDVMKSAATAYTLFKIGENVSQVRLGRLQTPYTGSTSTALSINSKPKPRLGRSQRNDKRNAPYVADNRPQKFSKNNDKGKQQKPSQIQPVVCALHLAKGRTCNHATKDCFLDPKNAAKQQLSNAVDSVNPAAVLKRMNMKNEPETS